MTMNIRQLLLMTSILAVNLTYSQINTVVLPNGTAYNADTRVVTISEQQALDYASLIKHSDRQEARILELNKAIITQDSIINKQALYIAELKVAIDSVKTKTVNVIEQLVQNNTLRQNALDVNSKTAFLQPAISASIGGAALTHSALNDTYSVSSLALGARYSSNYFSVGFAVTPFDAKLGCIFDISVPIIRL